MTDTDRPRRSRLPSREEVQEVLGFVPQVEAYFHRAKAEMPDELWTIFSAHKLTARHGAVLPQLVVEPELAVGELAARMGVSLPTASELVGALDRAGLVVRTEDPANRRRTLVSLADEHRAKVEGFIAGRAEPVLRVLERLSARDRAGFVAGLAAWAHEVRNW